VIELVSGARRLGGEMPSVVGIDRPLQRHASRHIDAGIGEAVELRWIIREQPHPRAAEQLQHAHRDAVIALVVVETQDGIGVDGMETGFLQLIGADLVGEAQAAAFLLQIKNDPAAMLLELRQRQAKLMDKASLSTAPC
jgi:hypothetical protein